MADDVSASKDETRSVKGPARISVVIPAHNAERWLGETLDSVLSQSLPAHEILVIDDGSVDATKEVALSYGNKIRYLRQPQQGVSAARNVGIESATGDWIAFLDSDDLYRNEALAKHAEAIRQRPELVISYSGFEIWHVDDTRQEMKAFRARSLWPALRYRTPILPSTVVARRQTLLEVGMFRVGQHYAEDWDLWLRLMRRYGPKAFQDIPECLTIYRQWEGNATAKFMKTAAARLTMLDSVLLEDLSGPRKALWKRRIQARVYFHIALELRREKNEHYWAYMIESLTRWPFVGLVVPPHRYKVFASMMLQRLRRLTLKKQYWWPSRACCRDLLS